MREVIEMHKDFITDSVVCSKKIKPNSKIKGKVNISLYDDNNNLVKEIHTENLIMDWFKDETYERGFVELAGNNRYTNTNLSVNPFSYLVLSSQDAEEDSTNQFVLKDAIGYAQRRTAYTGDSTTKGGYNSEESKVYEDSEGNLVCEEVYDFPSHCCNGTINSLMWSPYYANNNTFTGGYISGSRYKFRDYAQYNEELNSSYFLTDYFLIIRTDYTNKKEIYVGALRTPTADMSYDSSLYHSTFFDFKNNRILGGIYNSYSSASFGIPSKHFLFAEWSMGGSINTSKYKICNSSIYQYDIGGHTYVSDSNAFYDGDKYIYMSIKRSSDAKYKGVAKINFEDNTLVKAYVFETPCSSTGYGRTIKQSENIFRFCIGDIDCLFDNDLNLVKQYPTNRGLNVLVGYENLSWHRSSSTYEVKLINTPVTTYLKLSQPIEKTDKNALKVKYSFVIEQPKVKQQILGKIK